MSSSSEEEEYEIAPLDIHIEIMKRLPVKSLMKFRAVSKQWKSIIHTSEFIADYNRHIQQQPHQVFVGYDLFSNFVDIFDDDDDDDDISFLQRLTLPPELKIDEFIGYSQGLFAFFSYYDSVVIWNPAIRKSVVTPSVSTFDQTHFVFSVCNATGPMILKATFIPEYPHQVEIFTLSTGSWRTLSNPPRESLPITYPWGARETVPGVAIDSFIHWIAYKSGRHLILSFDITSEQYTELCLPPTFANSYSYTLRLSKCKESLVVLERDFCKQEIGVWMMMMEPGVQNSFTKLYTVKPPYISDFPTVLGFRKNGKPIIFADFPSHNRVLLFYESNLKRFNDFEVSVYPSAAGSYMETLLLLDH